MASMCFLSRLTSISYGAPAAFSRYHLSVVCVFRFLSCIFSVCAASLTAFSATHYIRADATGSNNGSSWANAWTSFANVSWVRGDVYYIAGGAYTGTVTISKGAASTLWITLKKANQNDNGADAGWSSNYATTQVVITGNIVLGGGFIEINGVTGSNTSGHGIQIYNPNNTTVVSIAGGTGPYKLQHLEIKGSGYKAAAVAIDGVSYNNTTALQKNFYVGYCWIHEVSRNGMTVGGLVGTSYNDYGMLFENNVLSETGGAVLLDPNVHGQGLQISYANQDAFTIIRNDVFRNVIGTGMIVWLGGGISVHHDALVYNNVFYITDLTTYPINSPGIIYSHTQATAAYNISIYNNSVYGIGSGSVTTARGSVIIATVGAYNNTLKNNVWEKCYLPSPHRGIAVQSNNGYYGIMGSSPPTGTTNQISGLTSTFTNPVAGDFRLFIGAYAVGKALNLDDIFTQDYTGLVRGGTWDIGAYQFDTTAPLIAPPLNAHVSASVR